MKKLTILCAASLALSTASSLAAYTDAQFNSVISPQEAEVRDIREQEISQLRVVMGRRFEDNRKPDLLLRLAELYFEKHRFYFLKENEVYQAQLKAGQKVSKVDHVASNSALQSAGEALKAILATNIPYNKMDQVYYFLGYNAQALNKQGEAIKNYTLVIEKFPESTYASEAYRNMAEYAFADRKFEQAASYYEKAAKFTNIPSYPRTLYKLAWAYYRLRRYSDSLNTMKKAYSSAKDEKFMSFKEEALTDIVFFYSEAGKYEEARDYFKGISGGIEIYIRALNKLGKQYEREGKHKLAIAVYEGLFKEHGKSNQALAFETLMNIAELYARVGDIRNEEATIERLIGYFRENKDDIVARDEDAVTVEAKKYIRGKVTTIHKAAVKRKDKHMFSKAADLYALYAETFLIKSSTEAARQELSQIRIYRSDALLAADREMDAIPELRATLKDSKGDIKFRKEAGTSLLNTQIKRIDAAHKAGKSSDEIETEFASDAATFEEVFPNDPLNAELRYKRARLSVARSGPEGLSSTARNDLAELIEKYPTREEAVIAAHDLVSDKLKRKQSGDAVELANAYLANKPLMATDKKGDLRKFLASVISRQDFTKAQEIEQNQDYVAAAAEYEKLAKSQDKEVAFKALNNAAVSYEKAGLPEQALAVYERVASAYPGKSNAKDEMKRVALQRVASSEFTKAAGIYAKLASSNHYSPEERKAFLRSAITLYWGTKDLAAANAATEKYLKEYCGKGSEKSCAEMHFNHAEILNQSGKIQLAVRALSGLADKGSAHANHEIAILLSMLDPVKSKASHKRAVDLAMRNKKDPQEARAGAHSAFILAEPLYNEFNSIRLEMPEDKMKAATKKKLALADQLVQKYQQIVSFGDGEWGIAALGRLGYVFSAFADQIKNAPVPQRISSNEDFKKKYADSLKTVWLPMKTRSVEFFKQAHSKGVQLGTTSSTFVDASRGISQLLPKQYPAAEFEYEALPLGLLGNVKTTDEDDLKDIRNSWRMDVGARLLKNPKDSDAWIELGNMEAIMGHSKLARLAYEQAVSINPKNANAIGNLALLLIQEKDAIAAGAEMARAVKLSAGKEILHNYAKHLLEYHQFASALKFSQMVYQKHPEDRAIQITHAVALTGNGKWNEAKNLLDQVDAKSSNRFSLWYNWCVWASQAGSSSDREDAVDKLESKSASLDPVQQASAKNLLRFLQGDSL